MKDNSAAFAPSRTIPIFKTHFYAPIKNIVTELSDAFEQNGDVLQVTGFPARVFVFRNPEHVAQIYKHEAGRTKNERILPRVKWVMRNGGYILRGGSLWKERRLQVQASFKSSFLTGYANQVPKITGRMLQHWTGLEGTDFDICREFESLFTQVIFKMFFSKSISGAKLEEVREQTHFVNANFVQVSPLWFPLPRNLLFRRYVIELRKTMLEVIRERKRDRENDRQDFLSVLLAINDPQTGQPWSEDEIVDEIFSVYFGAWVMGTSLSWCAYMLATHPAVQEKLALEAEGVLQGREPRFEDLDKLVYSQMVVRETLRLYPASWGYPHYTEEGMELGGYHIAPKSYVIPMVYHTHRNPSLWPEPEKFDPERFHPDRSTKIHPFAFYPFGGGARACLGINLTPMIMRLIITMIQQRFRLEFKPRFPADPVAEFGFEFHPQDQIRMALHRARS